MKTLDCRGLACPQPVVLCRDLVNTGVTALEAVVDNEPALENVQRFLQTRGFSVSTRHEEAHVWRITAAAGQMIPTSQEAPQAGEHAGQEAKTLVLITTETIGRGDEGLGARLMDSFLTTLPELGARLWRIVLINGGVKLAARPGPALEALKRMEADGVSILVCGTCLSHYGLLEARGAGAASNMLDIVTSLDLADKVIRP